LPENWIAGLGAQRGLLVAPIGPNSIRKIHVCGSQINFLHKFGRFHAPIATKAAGTNEKNEMSSDHDMQRTSRHNNSISKVRWGYIGILLAGLFTGIVGLSGCASKVFYTQDYRVKVDCAGIDPSKLQFYNDKEFLIRRRTTSKEVKSIDGVVSQTEGVRVQDIRVRRGTPCRVDSVSGNFYWVRFEIGEGNVVRFYKNAFDHYQIGADKWVRGRGNIVYGGKDCEIERVGNDCLLQVKNYQTFRDKKQRNIAGGLRVGTEIRDSIEVEEDLEE
jgi:hypothetical protein